MNKTTKRVLNFIIGYKHQHTGRSPTRREIVEGCGMSSTSVVTHHLENLVKSGDVLEYGGTGESRNIRLRGEVWYLKEQTL